MNATDSELKSAVSLCGLVAKLFGLVLLAGLLIEVRLAFLHLPYDSPWETWGQVSANILVASGVGGELIFSHLGSASQGELLRRTEEALAEALRLADDAWSMDDKAGDKAREAEILAMEASGKDPYDRYL